MRICLFLVCSFYFLDFGFTEHGNACEEKCGENEFCSQCGNRCDPTCLTGDHVICPRVCDEPACMCKEGFFRQTTSGKCIKAEMCSKSRGDKRACKKKRGINAEISTAARGCISGSCVHPHTLESRCRKFPGCICKPGYLLSAQLICISSDECP